MLKKNSARGPNYIHPEKPSAVGSRNSLHRNERDEYLEASIVIDEEIDKILNHVKAKLPPEVLNKLDIMGGVKEKLHNYYNQNLQNMQNRYIVTVEDELLKKYRDLVDREEYNQLNQYSPRAISEIMDKIGGPGQFDTGAIERSITSIFKHLQDHIHQGVHDLEDETNTMFRQKSDVGSFVQKENAYAVVKCAFKNNPIKPETVTDVKLAINILDSELIVPIYHYHQSMQDLLKETISRHIRTQIDSKIAELNRSESEEGLKEISESEIVAEKLKELENHLSFEGGPEDENGKQYDYVAKRFFDSLNDMDSEGLENKAYIKDHVKMILEKENIQTKGFNRAVNALTSILDSSKLGYQYINNYKNARACVIQEYSSVIKDELPDETFAIKICYLNVKQLKNLRKVYSLQAVELSNEIEKVGRVIDKLLTEIDSPKNIPTYRDISKQALRGTKGYAKTKNGDCNHLWHEVSLTRLLSSGNKESTYREFNNKVKKQIGMLQKKVYDVFGNNNSKTRRILDERINFLKEAFQNFSNQINPHHVQQGLVLEVDITSVKKKKTTINAMSNVLNEFLIKVSKGSIHQSIDVIKPHSPVASKDLEQKFTSVLQEMDRSLEEINV